MLYFRVSIAFRNGKLAWQRSIFTLQVLHPQDEPELQVPEQQLEQSLQVDEVSYELTERREVAPAR